MSLGYIRRYYDVPAWRGQRVMWRGRPGKIVSSSGPHIRVRLDDHPHGACVILHPKEDELTYLPTDDSFLDQLGNTGGA